MNFLEKNLAKALDLMERADSSTAHCIYPPIAAWAPLKSANAIKSWRETLKSGNQTGIYVHVPFCNFICRFCKAAPKYMPGENDIEEFLVALAAEAKILSPVFRGTKLVSLFFGGGTPNLLNPDQIKKLFSIIYSNFSFTKNAQIIVEVSSEYLDDERLKEMVKNKVTGLSLGVQSLDVNMSKWAGYNRDSIGIRDSFFRARAAGIKYILVDLLCGLPGQTEKSFLKDVKTVASWKPDDIVLGEFSFVNTAFESLSGGKQPALREHYQKMIKKGFEILGSKGYKSFGNNPNASLRPYSSRSKHNYLFYGRVSMLGMGPGAISYTRNRLWYANVSGFQNYKNRIKSGILPVENGCAMTRRREMVNFIFEGIDRGKISASAFKEEFGETIEKKINANLVRLTSKGILERRGSAYYLLDQKKAYYDSALEFFEPEIIKNILKRTKK